METETYKKLKDSQQDNFPEYIIIHHSAANATQTVKSIEDYHISLGWEGVGYQYLITNKGEVYKGRPETYHGAHVSEKGINKKSIGICLIGNFDIDKPTGSQVLSLIGLMKDILKRYPSIKVKYHRDFNPKSCPGKNISNEWGNEMFTLAKQDEMVSVPKKLLVELSKYL